MNRIFEYIPAQEAAIVSRVLIAVHKAIDEQFPGAIKASRQFTKTVFSDTAESTAADRVPGVPPPPTAARRAERGYSPPEADAPVPNKVSKAPTRPSPSGLSPASSITHHSQYTGPNSQGLSNPIGTQFGEDSNVRTIRTKAADWAMRLTIVALLFGIAFLAYVLVV